MPAKAMKMSEKELRHMKSPSSSRSARLGSSPAAVAEAQEARWGVMGGLRERVQRHAEL
ncbi:hypothetical protein GCM10020254_39430 [Streptomyces goshikiensis]